MRLTGNNDTQTHDFALRVELVNGAARRKRSEAFDGVVPSTRLRAGNGDSGNFGVGWLSWVCGKFPIFPLGLRDRRKNIARLARRRDKVDSSVAQSFEVFVPICQTRGHDDGNSAGRSLRETEKVAVSAIRQAALAKNEAHILLCEKIMTLVQARGVQRAPAVLLEDGDERAAVVQIRRDHQDLRTIVHVNSPQWGALLRASFNLFRIRERERAGNALK
jgi:hypothetical protein